LIQYPAKRKGETFKVPNTVKTIKFRAFENADKLKKVNVGKNVTEINYLAFFNMDNLETLVLKTKKISALPDNWATDCPKLTLVKGPNNKVLKKWAKKKELKYKVI